MSARRLLLLFLLPLLTSAFALTACGPNLVRLKPRAPGPSAQIAPQQGVAKVSVTPGPEITGSKLAILSDRQVPQAMQSTALKGFEMGGQKRPDGVAVNVIITGFRTGAYGATTMTVNVAVSDASGNQLKQYELNSASATGFGDRVERVAQDITMKILDQT